MDYEPKYILVHHSAATTPNPQFQAINEWHRARQFAMSSLGFYVGYHRVIEQDGTVVVARDDLERDCDALGHNFDSLSVCLVGDFSKDEPTVAQRVALGKVLAEWSRKYGIHPTLVYPHRHFAQTTCYGSKLENNFARDCLMAELAGAASPSLVALAIKAWKGVSNMKS